MAQHQTSHSASKEQASDAKHETLVQSGSLYSFSLVRTPKLARSLATVAIVFVLIVVASLIWVPWQQTVAGSGSVTSFDPSARAQTIESPISGRIVAWRIQEGAMVRRGDTLAILQDINVNFMAPDFVERLESSRDNILLAQDASIAAALERTKQAVQSLEASRAFDATRAELGVARIRFNRTKNLVDSGLVSQRDVESAYISYTKSLNDSIRTEAALRSARQNLDAVKAEQERVERQAKATIADAELRLGNAQSRRDASAIISPINGQVTRIAKAGLGQTVKEGDRLAVVVPFTSDIAAEIFLSGMDAALVDIGRDVTLQFAGYPAFQFSGFPQVSSGIFRGRVAAIDAVDDGKGKYRVLVVPDTTHGNWADRSYLRQGSAVSGWVLLNSVPLGYELWRQLNGFPPQFPIRQHEYQKDPKDNSSSKEK